MSTLAQRSFAGGELAPALYARVDQVKYATGLRTCRNYEIMRHGGALSRPGTYFTTEVKDSTKAISLIPFIFNADQTYVLEFGNLYMRVIRNGAQVEVSGVAAWSGATAYVIGDLVVSAGTNYYCVAAHTNHVPPNGTYWYALTGSIYEIPTPYLEADLADLKYNQSADVVTLTHPSYAVRELARSGHTAWTLSLVTFAPSIATPESVTNNGAAGSTTEWVVTAIDSESFEESLQSTSTGSSATPSSGSPITISWAAVSGAGQYNIYKKTNGIYGFIGVAGGTSFIDNGIEADETDTPPTDRNPFDSTNNYPSTSGYYQQRLGFANTNNDTEKVWFGRSGNFKNFSTSIPLQDDDAVTFNLAGRQVNSVKHLLDLGELIVFTSGAEWFVEGDVSGILKPGEINPRQKSYYGSSDVPPLVVGSTALFIQARGSIVRDLLLTISSDGTTGLTGNDLTVFSAHMFDAYTILNWAYQQIPNSIIWAVRSDGTLLGFTYVREHQLWAWHRHDFQSGIVENVCVVPEGNQDALYLCIRRTIDGSSVRYIERMTTRQIDDIVDFVGMDCALTYDGRNTAATTMTLTGSGWTYTDTLTLTSSAGYFVGGDVGKEIHINGLDNDGNPTVLRCNIITYSSPTVVLIKPNKTVPTAMRSAATADWGKAIKTVSGLDHLEGEEVSVFADGFVIASPNNDSYGVLTVSSGAITLDKCYVVIHTGLPITADIETLDIDNPNGETIADKKMIVTKVTAHVEKTRGIFAGPKPPTDDTVDPLEDLVEAKLRSEEGYDEPVDLLTGKVEIKIESHWNSNGRVFIRQVDPVPSSILSILPNGLMPFK